MFRTVRRMPLFRVLAVAQLALAARRHLQNLTPLERRRMGALVRRGHALSPEERDELRALAGKLDARAFAATAVDAFSPVGVGRFMRGRPRF